MIRDTTFCASNKCKNICERHVNSVKFDPEELIWMCDFDSEGDGTDCLYRKESKDGNTGI